MPASAVEATGQILEALREGRSRRIGLGKADDRWFTFCAGLGIDAAVVERVESKRAKGKRSTHSLYVRSAVNRFYLATARRKPVAAAERAEPARAARRLRRARLQHRSVDLSSVTGRCARARTRASTSGSTCWRSPGCRPSSTLRAAGRFFAKDSHPHSKHALLLHDQPELIIEAIGEPLPFQVDGDALGRAREASRLTSVPGALRVIV